MSIQPPVEPLVETTIESRLAHLTAVFAAHFGAPPEVAAQAPGRVNLIGEHTDYNDGFVLPCAIDRNTLVVARRRTDRQVRVAAIDMGPGFDQFHLDDRIGYRPDQLWCNYVRGMVVELQTRGFRLEGVDLAISGDIPQGAGLSSSASIEVVVGQVFKGLCDLEFDATALAQAAQRAENDFVGCQCGVMDQLVSAAGRAGHALLIDCRSLALTPIALPAEAAILIVHSRVRRGLVESAYNERRHQCEVAAQYFNVKALRDVPPGQLQDAVQEAALDATVLRRAQHVVSENARTLAAAKALARGDMTTMGRLMAASHTSMRGDFEITVPPIDRLVDILQPLIGDAGGARMTGGGFGGCVVALLPAALVPAAIAAVAAGYRSPEGEPAICYVCRASGGASSLDIRV
jgi:galactokinase